MWRGLDRSFTRALEREGVQVQVSDTTKTVLFRRKRDNADGGDWLDAYTRQEDGFKAGDLLAVGGDNYLLVQRDHRENSVYIKAENDPNSLKALLQLNETLFKDTGSQIFALLDGVPDDVIGEVKGE